MSLAMSRTGVSTLQLAGLEVMTLLTVGMALSSGRIGARQHARPRAMAP
jgi:hypothetical protein